MKTWESLAEVFPDVKRSGSYKELVCIGLSLELSDAQNKQKGSYFLDFLGNFTGPVTL